MAALVALVARRIGFEVRAGQVVKKDVEAGAEQILPAPTQMGEQSRFMLKQLVEAAIERVLLDQRKISAEQIAHGALLEPQPVQAPLAAWIDEPVADQRLEDVAPAGPLARIGQTSRPETVEFQLLIELTGEPARPPLPRPVQLHGPEPDLHPMALGVIGQRPIGGEQGQLSGLLRPLVEGLDHPAPAFLLAVVDFAEIEDLALHDFAAGAALALDNAPLAVLLAVLEASIRGQRHDEQIYAKLFFCKGTWSPLHANFETSSLKQLAFRSLTTPKFAVCLRQLRKSG